MDGYYDYGPTLDLRHHVVLIGLLGEETRTIAYRASALCGLPVTDVDRVIEHQAARSIWDLIWSEGEARYREMEAEQTRAALAARPFGLISLGDGALINEALRAHVLAHAVLISLEMDLANCYWRLQGTARSTTDYWHPLHTGPLERIEQVRPFFSLRRPGLDAAHHRIELGGSSVERAVDKVTALLNLLPAQRTSTPAATPSAP